MSIPFDPLAGKPVTLPSGPSQSPSSARPDASFSRAEAQAWEKIFEQTRAVSTGNQPETVSVRGHRFAQMVRVTPTAREAASQKHLRTSIQPASPTSIATAKNHGSRPIQTTNGAMPRHESLHVTHQLPAQRASAGCAADGTVVLAMTAAAAMTTGHLRASAHTVSGMAYTATADETDVGPYSVHVLKSGDALTLVMRGPSSDEAEALRTGLEAARHVPADVGSFERIVLNGKLIWQRTCSTHPTQPDSSGFSC